jgi:hypothetical protein
MKNIPTFESFINEAKVDLHLASHDEMKGVMARFRISSTVVNLRSVVNLSKDPSVKFCTVFGPDEIGFEDASSRKAALNYIQKAFDSGKLKISDYEINESELNETTINRFAPAHIEKNDALDPRFFAKLMPRTAKTVNDATESIYTWSGNTMFVHYQYHIVKPNGNRPDRPTYRLHQSQYWLNDTQLKWQGREGEKVNVTLLQVIDITDPANEKRLGQVYVSTDALLDEMGRTFEILKRQS